jgi:hypothetical protein
MCIFTGTVFALIQRNKSVKIVAKLNCFLKQFAFHSFIWQITAVLNDCCDTGALLGADGYPVEQIYILLLSCSQLNKQCRLLDWRHQDSRGSYLLQWFST